MGPCIHLLGRALHFAEGLGMQRGRGKQGQAGGQQPGGQSVGDCSAARWVHAVCVWHVVLLKVARPVLRLRRRAARKEECAG